MLILMLMLMLTKQNPIIKHGCCWWWCVHVPFFIILSPPLLTNNNESWVGNPHISVCKCQTFHFVPLWWIKKNEWKAATKMTDETDIGNGWRSKSEQRDSVLQIGQHERPSKNMKFAFASKLYVDFFLLVSKGKRAGLLGCLKVDFNMNLYFCQFQ